MEIKIMLQQLEQHLEEAINWGVRLDHPPPPAEISQVHEYGFIRYNSFFSRRGSERDDCLLMVTYRGSGIARHHDRQVNLSRGMVSLFLTGEDHYYGGTNWEAFWFHFYPSKALKDLLRLNAIEHGNTFEKHLSDACLEQLNSIFHYHQLDEALAMYRCSVLVEYFILSSLPFPDIGNAVLRPMRIQDIESYLQRNPVDGYYVKSLAKMLNLSPSRFAHLFKSEYGISVHAYITKMRMDRARKLLISTKLTVKEIAEELRYATPEHFHAAFKKQFGMPPGHYRKTASKQTIAAKL
eukprot:TRINITY_DN7948_c0_g1_i2.p2 TRINITY_DN7948_c0_g1~~TRINITY_DN7948_c0_g1_i2.p2  ORF type:complete len:295 (+),score=38.02 TRINITY_DN7948_c0_g1_i2:225-1109(+)